MLEYILELIYPTTCGFCGKICKDAICKKCELELKQYEINLIRKNKKYYKESMHLYKYEGTIRKKIIDYKFNNKAYLYKTFAKIILKNKKVCGFLKNYDIIIPVPIHKKRKLKRGYNQTELIAKEIAKYTHLKMENKVLLKNKNIVTQSLLNKKKREQNVKNAFYIKNVERILNKKILIFDDIFTTGSTVLECAKIFKKIRTKEIGVLTIAKD
ncbi:MAG: ComF family protein [Clostridia bacterium]|nr:ComF family protein [Clostridia bacterium]